MTKCLKKLSQFTVLNWIMLWFFLMNGGILLLPAEKFSPAVELWLSSHSVYWWAGLIISVSYFLSQAVIVLFNLAVDFLSRHVSSVKMTDMIKCLDFTERAVLREFVIREKERYKPACYRTVCQEPDERRNSDICVRHSVAG